MAAIADQESTFPNNAGAIRPTDMRTRRSAPAPNDSDNELPAVTESGEIPRWMRQLKTDANKTLSGDKADGDGGLGVYTWKGAVYQIDKNTPREWIEAEAHRHSKKEKEREKKSEEPARQQSEPRAGESQSKTSGKAREDEARKEQSGTKRSSSTNEQSPKKRSREGEQQDSQAEDERVTKKSRKSSKDKPAPPQRHYLFPNLGVKTKKRRPRSKAGPDQSDFNSESRESSKESSKEGGIEGSREPSEWGGMQSSAEASGESSKAPPGNTQSRDGREGSKQTSEEVNKEGSMEGSKSAPVDIDDGDGGERSKADVGSMADVGSKANVNGIADVEQDKQNVEQDKQEVEQDKQDEQESAKSPRLPDMPKSFTMDITEQDKRTLSRIVCNISEPEADQLAATIVEIGRINSSANQLHAHYEGLKEALDVLKETLVAKRRQQRQQQQQQQQQKAPPDSPMASQNPSLPSKAVPSLFHDFSSTRSASSEKLPLSSSSSSSLLTKSIDRPADFRRTRVGTEIEHQRTRRELAILESLPTLLDNLPLAKAGRRV